MAGLYTPLVQVVVAVLVVSNCPLVLNVLPVPVGGLGWMRSFVWDDVFDEDELTSR